MNPVTENNALIVINSSGSMWADDHNIAKGLDSSLIRRNNDRIQKSCLKNTVGGGNKCNNEIDKTALYSSVFSSYSFSNNSNDTTPYSTPSSKYYQPKSKVDKITTISDSRGFGLCKKDYDITDSSRSSQCAESYRLGDVNNEISKRGLTKKVIASRIVNAAIRACAPLNVTSRLKSAVVNSSYNTTKNSKLINNNGSAAVYVNSSADSCLQEFKEYEKDNGNGNNMLFDSSSLEPVILFDEIVGGGGEESQTTQQTHNQIIPLGAAVTNANVETTVLAKASKQRAAAKAESKPVHSIFYKAAALTDDKLWKDVFTKMSRGIYRKGFKYYPNGEPVTTEAGDELPPDVEVGRYVYRTKTKDFDCPIFNNPETALNDVKNFMAKRINLISDEEQRNIDNIVRDGNTTNQLENIITLWTDVKTENSKRVLSRHYVNELASAYKLSSQDKSDLLSVVSMGISCELFNETNIQIKNGTISHIKGIVRSETTNRFILDPALMFKEQPLTTRDVIKNSPFPAGTSSRILSSSIFNKIINKDSLKVENIYNNKIKNRKNDSSECSRHHYGKETHKYNQHYYNSTAAAATVDIFEIPSPEDSIDLVLEKCSAFSYKTNLLPILTTAVSLVKSIGSRTSIFISKEEEKGLSTTITTATTENESTAPCKEEEDGVVVVPVSSVVGDNSGGGCCGEIYSNYSNCKFLVKRESELESFISEITNYGIDCLKKNYSDSVFTEEYLDLVVTSPSSVLMTRAIDAIAGIILKERYIGNKYGELDGVPWPLFILKENTIDVVKKRERFTHVSKELLKLIESEKDIPQEAVQKIYKKALVLSISAMEKFIRNGSLSTKIIREFFVNDYSGIYESGFENLPVSKFKKSVEIANTLKM